MNIEDICKKTSMPKEFVEKTTLGLSKE